MRNIHNTPKHLLLTSYPTKGFPAVGVVDGRGTLEPGAVGVTVGDVGGADVGADVGAAAPGLRCSISKLKDG